MSNIKEKQKLSWEGMFYSIQRIDLLIISICGGGIYVSLETLKYLTENNMNINCLIRIAGAFFLFGIIVNFLSQLFGYKANEQDFLMCEKQIQCENNPTLDEEDYIKKYDLKATFFSNWTTKLNYISVVLMFLGLLSIMFFFLIIF